MSDTKGTERRAAGRAEAVISGIEQIGHTWNMHPSAIEELVEMARERVSSESSGTNETESLRAQVAKLRGCLEDLACIADQDECDPQCCQQEDSGSVYYVEDAPDSEHSDYCPVYQLDYIRRVLEASQRDGAVEANREAGRLSDLPDSAHCVYQVEPVPLGPVPLGPVPLEIEEVPWTEPWCPACGIKDGAVEAACEAMEDVRRALDYLPADCLGQANLCIDPGDKPSMVRDELITQITKALEGIS